MRMSSELAGYTPEEVLTERPAAPDLRELGRQRVETSKENVSTQLEARMLALQTKGDQIKEKATSLADRLKSFAQRVKSGAQAGGRQAVAAVGDAALIATGAIGTQEGRAYVANQTKEALNTGKEAVMSTAEAARDSAVELGIDMTERAKQASERAKARVDQTLERTGQQVEAIKASTTEKANTVVNNIRARIQAASIRLQNTMLQREIQQALAREMALDAQVRTVQERRDRLAATRQTLETASRQLGATS